MEETRILLSEAAHEGLRLDKFLSDSYADLTRSAVQRLCEAGCVVLEGVGAAQKNYKLREAERITLSLPPIKSMEAVPQEIPLSILFEDEHLLVVNKPKGMVVHPAAGNPDGTLVNALLYHCQGTLSGVGGVERPGIVHRIDKDTSGLLVVAKTDRAHYKLSEEVKAHSFTRVYRSVVYGNLKENLGTIDAPIGRHPTERKRMTVRTDGRPAITHYRVIERYQGFTHIELRLETGRTHQIRVHMHYLGHPVAGDPVYGPKKVINSLSGQCLHAEILGFHHPISGAYLEFNSPLPDYFIKFLGKCKI